MNRLEPSVKTVWALSILLRFLILSIIFFIGELIIIKPNLIWELPLGATSLGLFLFAVAMAFIIPPIKYKYWMYEIREEELFIKRGIITRVSTIAPFSRIQHIDVQQSLIERIMNLSKLVIYTAGTRGADLVIPGLPLEYAEMLREQLKVYTVEDAV